MTSASLEKFNVAKKRKMQEEDDDDVSLSDSSRSVIWQYFEKIKSEKDILRRCKACKKISNVLLVQQYFYSATSKVITRRYVRRLKTKEKKLENKKKKNQTYKRFTLTRNRTD